MSRLFTVLSTIMDANPFGHADTVKTLQNPSLIQPQAAALDLSLNEAEARYLSEIGLIWIEKVENGPENWELYRQQAKQSLERHSNTSTLSPPTADTKNTRPTHKATQFDGNPNPEGVKHTAFKPEDHSPWRLEKRNEPPKNSD